mmetsp:Transcript_22970/g.45826  ORF Transcript_22970/g.45826 Transcript_22970/m.45826 type:complete len:155 (+) Transcript_22970:841-1305(+)
MAPEVMTDGGRYGPQCDVYSAGCVIYSLLSGFYPFDATSCDEFEAIVKARPSSAPAPTEYAEWDDVSQEAKDFLNALMQHDPKSRPTASEALGLDWLAKAEAGGEKGKKIGWKAGVKDSTGGKKKKTVVKSNTKRRGKHTHISAGDHVCTTSTE